MSRHLKYLLPAAVFVCFSATAYAEDIEVLHYWTSGGESKAVAVLKQTIEKQGYTWKDSAVAGGGGANAMTVLKTRVVSGTPPAAVQMRGPVIQDWAEQGALAPIDAVAGDWAKVLPPPVNAVLQYKGHYYAAPHWIGRANWMWINKAALDKVGGKPPTTWDEFFALADKMKAAGYTAIAHGETPYEDGYLFQDVVYSMGTDFFRKAFLEKDQATLTSPKMVQVFDILRRMQGYFDNGTQGRAWNMSVAMLIQDKAGMFFMGDWAKGEFAVAGKVPGKDYVCVQPPGGAAQFAFIADTFVFFRQHGQPATKAQLDMAADIMSPAYQQVAANYKGAIPANTTVSLDTFDSCSQQSGANLKAAAASGDLFPSMNQGVDEARLGAVMEVVAKFMNSTQDSKSAVQALANASKAN
jgi:glucose/mannose transport system substrate-binding protein